MPNFAFGRQDNKEIKEIFVMAANNGTFWRFKTPNPGLIGPGGTRRAVAATFARSSRRRGPIKFELLAAIKERFADLPVMTVMAYGRRASSGCRAWCGRVHHCARRLRPVDGIGTAASVARTRVG
jgi:hypothetical protein